MTDAKVKKATLEEVVCKYVEWIKTHKEDYEKDPVTMIVNFFVDTFGYGDEELRAKLMAERPGILNWLLDGVQELETMRRANENVQ